MQYYYTQPTQLFSFQPLTHEHWPQVRTIYLERIATGEATFQTTTPNWHEWDQDHLPHSRIVATNNSTVAGWAVLSPVSARPHYRWIAEVSVYVGEGYRGGGLGSQLPRELVQQSEQNRIWTLQGSIFPENKASVHIHEKNGFRLMGRRERIARQNSVWRDTVILECRGKIVGND